VSPRYGRLFRDRIVWAWKIEPSPQRVFDLGSILASATGIEVLRLLIKKRLNYK
jgi:hypothetical protein